MKSQNEKDRELRNDLILYQISEADMKLKNARINLRKCFHKKQKLIEELKNNDKRVEKVLLLE